MSKHYLAITDGHPVARECDASLAQRGKRVAVDLAEGVPAYTEIAIERTSPDFQRQLARKAWMAAAISSAPRVPASSSQE